MSIDWFSAGLAFLIVMIFAAIFTLLRTMSSPYIKRFEILVKAPLEEIEDKNECYRIRFNLEGRPFELLELKHETKENFKKVYDSFVILKATANTAFTLRIDDVLSKVNIGGVLEEVLNERLDNSASEISVRGLGEFFKDFRVSTNDAVKAQKFLSDPQVLEILSVFKTQFSAYGFLMSFMISKGVLIIDYSLSERLLNELIYNPRNLLEHARLLSALAVHIEQTSV
jgi:hypothetical protein